MAVDRRRGGPSVAPWVGRGVQGPRAHRLAGVPTARGAPRSVALVGRCRRIAAAAIAARRRRGIPTRAAASRPAIHARRTHHAALRHRVPRIALIAGVLGFGVIAGTAATIAKVLFLVFIVLFIGSLVLGRRGSI
jgi:uncharacterized membrane protein YtjA (UPF0391 family)